MSKKRRSFSAQFKAKVALEALKEQSTINEIASRHEVLPQQVSQWKAQLLEHSAEAFARGHPPSGVDAEVKAREDKLYRKIGQLEMECDFLKKKSIELGLLPGGKTPYDQ